MSSEEAPSKSHDLDLLSDMPLNPNSHAPIDVITETQRSQLRRRDGPGLGARERGGGGRAVPAGVPGVPGPHHPPGAAVHQGAPGLLRLLPEAAPLPHLQGGHVPGEEPRHGAGERKRRQKCCC